MRSDYKISWILKSTCKIIKYSNLFKSTIVEKQKQKAKKLNYRGLEKHTIGALNCYTMTSDSKDTIIYLHGGGYLLGIDNIHISFAKKLQKKSNTTLHIIDYHLAPKYKVDQIINEVLESIQILLASHKENRVYLIGDSAGGGMCLPILKKLDATNQNVEDVFLLSPWLDVSMSNKEIDDLKDVDIILNKEDLIECGNLYTDNQVKHFDASPIYDDYTTYHNIQIFTGTYDILYPDIEKFYHLNPKIKLHVFHQAPHDFMLFPYTKERELVIQTISRQLSNKLN